MGCTKKWCKQIQNPSCKDSVENPSTKNVTDSSSCLKDFSNNCIPSDCTEWFDGCNTCQIEEDESLMCTEMACFRSTEPNCLQFKPAGEGKWNSTMDDEPSWNSTQFNETEPTWNDTEPNWNSSSDPEIADSSEDFYCGGGSGDTRNATNAA
jgi:hypothetical protein